MSDGEFYFTYVVMDRAGNRSRSASVSIGPNSSTSDEVTTGSTDGQSAPEVTDLGLIPATEIQPEDIGSLSLRYTDGVPVLVVSGGTVVPAGLTVVDASGNSVAAYTAGPLPSTQPVLRSARFQMRDADDPLPDY